MVQLNAINWISDMQSIILICSSSSVNSSRSHASLNAQNIALWQASQSALIGLRKQAIHFYTLWIFVQRSSGVRISIAHSIPSTVVQFLTTRVTYSYLFDVIKRFWLFTEQCSVLVYLQRAVTELILFIHSPFELHIQRSSKKYLMRTHIQYSIKKIIIMWIRKSPEHLC